MSSTYTLNFSDPTKTDTITVPGTAVGPGKNNYSTSLELIGPGYTNFGQPSAQNLVKLLENFSSPHPPNNAIEGQLWYDTSNPDRKVLRVNNGTATSTRWPNVSGIYHQPNDPSVQYSLSVKSGDLWVDTSENQLKLRVANTWSVIGPGASSGLDKTGSEAAFVQSNTGTTYPIILNWANGKVVEVIAFNEFIPRTVIDGFTTIKPGSNLTNKALAKYNGLADRASALEVAPNVLIRSYEVLKNRVTSQTHTGTFIIQDATGLLVKNNFFPSESIRVYNTSGIGYVSLVSSSKPFKVGVGSAGSDAYIQFNPQSRTVGINTGSAVATLTVNGSGRFENTLTVTTTASVALSIAGGTAVGGKLTVSGDFQLLGATTATGLVTLGSLAGSGTILIPAANDVYDLGTTSTAFRKLFVSQIGATGTNVDIYGTVYGTATTLESARTFRVEGVVTTTVTSSFDGSANVVFTTTAHKSLITGQETTSTTAATLTMLVVNTSTTTSVLQQISKVNFLSDVYPLLVPTGMITPWPISTATSGYLICDGSEVSQTTYSALYNMFGLLYNPTPTAGTFKLPDMRYSTVLTKTTVEASTVSQFASAGTDTIALSTLTNITVGLMVDGYSAIGYGTSVASFIGTDSIKLSANIVGDIASGISLSFSTATYMNYVIKT
jgi:microcystin-dependent protein